MLNNWPFFIVIIILMSECQPETNVRPDGCASLSSSDRALNYTTKHEDCDSKIGTFKKSHGYTGSRWFRFEGAAGDNMALTCPYETDRCNTYATGWLNGGLPNVKEGPVTRQVCFYGSRARVRRARTCCEWAINVQVRNCGSYYVYNLTTTPGGECNLRYCGNNDYNAYGWLPGKPSIDPSYNLIRIVIIILVTVVTIIMIIIMIIITLVYLRQKVSRNTFSN